MMHIHDNGARSFMRELSADLYWTPTSEQQNHTSQLAHNVHILLLTIDTYLSVRPRYDNDFEARTLDDPPLRAVGGVWLWQRPFSVLQ